jgi:phytoene dehydrogenase-like protein
MGLQGLERRDGDAPLSVVAEPGRCLTLSREVRRAADAIHRVSPGDAQAWPAFAARLHRLASFLGAVYQAPAPDVDAPAGELPALLDLGRRFRGLGREDMVAFLRTLPLSVWELLDDAFENDLLKAAVAAGGVLDHRQGPRSGGTGFVLLHHLVGAPAGSVRGRAPWRAGPDAFTDAATRAAQAAGVTIRTGARVARVEVRDDAVAGVALAGGEAIATRCVVSTAGAASTLLGLVDPVWLDPEFMHAVGRIRHRGCTSYVLYALDAPPRVTGLEPEALGGIVSLTASLPALERAADAAKYGEVPAAPHIEITAPTALWPALAPSGRHVLVARVQYAPYALRDGAGAGWDAARRDALAESVTDAIEGVAPGFASRILHRVAWSPRDLEERFGLREGAPSHGELGLDQILFMRPVAGWGRHTTPVDGLYLGGAGSHPGPGVLGGAGWLAAGRVLEDARRAKRSR